MAIKILDMEEKPIKKGPNRFSKTNQPANKNTFSSENQPSKRGGKKGYQNPQKILKKFLSGFKMMVNKFEDDGSKQVVEVTYQEMVYMKLIKMALDENINAIKLIHDFMAEDNKNNVNEEIPTVIGWGSDEDFDKLNEANKDNSEAEGSI